MAELPGTNECIARATYEYLDCEMRAFEGYFGALALAALLGMVGIDIYQCNFGWFFPCNNVARMFGQALIIASGIIAGHATDSYHLNMANCRAAYSARLVRCGFAPLPTPPPDISGYESFGSDAFLNPLGGLDLSALIDMLRGGEFGADVGMLGAPPVLPTLVGSR